MRAFTRIALLFASGAAVGAAMAVASDPASREKFRNLIGSSRKVAKRVPEALREAGTAAKNALDLEELGSNAPEYSTH